MGGIAAALPHHHTGSSRAELGVVLSFRQIRDAEPNGLPGQPSLRRVLPASTSFVLALARCGRYTLTPPRHRR